MVVNILILLAMLYLLLVQVILLLKHGFIGLVTPGKAAEVNKEYLQQVQQEMVLAL